MSSFFKTIAAAAVLTIGFHSVSALYAADPANPPQGSHAPAGMISDNNMMMGPSGGGGMMGDGGTGGMMGMMNRMGRMKRMMDSCDRMMQGGMHAPNRQWSKPSRG